VVELSELLEQPDEELELDEHGFELELELEEQGLGQLEELEEEELEHFL
jgi:hypothetical protein